MRSAIRLALVAALAAASAGCGNYSTEDLRFLSALPRREHLVVAVPASTGAGPTALRTSALASTSGYSLTCPAGPTFGDATVWQWAKPISDDLNGAVTWIVGLIDNVRRIPPTHRSEDSRRWGPFDDDKHPGHEIQVVIDRSWPAGPDGPATYDYRFEARVTGTTVFYPLITGSFVGASSSHGDGWVALDFQSFWDVGVNEADTPHGSLTIDYSRSGDPLTTDLLLQAGTAGGFGVVSFGYGYAGYADGNGAFDYAFKNGFDDRLAVRTSYDPVGAGRLAVEVTPSGAPAPTASFRQCWDAAGCLVYVDDPANFTGACAMAPCLLGALGDCAAVKTGTEPF